MGGRRYYCLQDKVTHVSECLWLHAARRTAQIHAALAGLMHSEELLFEERRIPRKRFAKESFLHGMAYEAQMSRMDAQMAYAIVKRAFKVGP